MDFGKGLITIFTAIVGFSALYMILSNPAGANAVLGATVDTITGTTRALEGR